MTFPLVVSNSLTSLSKCLSETILHMSGESCTLLPYHSFRSCFIFSANFVCMDWEQST